MADTFRANLAEMIAYYVSWYSLDTLPKLHAKLLELEAAQYAYLPDPVWMLEAGYTSEQLGTYSFANYGGTGVVYRVEVLSQTSMVLLFREAYLLANQLVESDEQLVAFLQQHNLPFPSCE